MKWKIALFVILNIIVLIGYTMFVPDVTTDIALTQFDEGSANTRAAIRADNMFWLLYGLANMLLVIWIVWKPLKKGKESMMKALGMIALVGMAMMFGGCREYNEDIYEEIGNSETAYLIELDDSDQVKYDSAEALDKQKVAARRVQIPRRWKSTGYFYMSGEYIPTVRIVKVDRAPVTREWTAEAENGTVKKDQGIWVESSDSIGFSTGFNCTARIDEKDASTFLYYYPAHDGAETGRSRLAIVMDDEIRNKIQEIAADYAAGYDLDELRERKQEMVKKIREEVVPFFASRGITVTTVGMFGGFAYENEKIQASIDEVFVAQQLKNQESALLEAMSAKEERMKREGIAIANQRREEALGQADAVKLAAQAESEAITLVNNALEKAQSNPLFIKVKSLEVESERIKAWDGTVPKFMMGSSEGGGFVPMIQIPSE